MLFDKNIESFLDQRQSYGKSMHVAAVERYARLQWDHLLIPMCCRGSALQFDMRYGNVAVKSSKEKLIQLEKRTF